MKEKNSIIQNVENRIKAKFVCSRSEKRQNLYIFNFVSDKGKVKINRKIDFVLGAIIIESEKDEFCSDVSLREVFNFHIR